MVQESLVERIVREVIRSMQTGEPVQAAGGSPASRAELDPVRDYPLATRRPELVKTPTGKALSDITLESALKGAVTPQDVRITPETLEMQAAIAERVGRVQFARNLRRAAELTRISDERILQIYRALRPYRSTKKELLDIADELEHKYGATMNAALVREAADVYERRGRLRSA